MITISIITQTTYTADGSTVNYIIPFEYLSREHVKVIVDDKAAEFTFGTTNTIILAAAPLAGSKIKIYRQTPFDQPQITWTDGTVLIADDLNAQLLQVLFVLQENEALFLISDFLEQARAIQLTTEQARDDTLAISNFLGKCAAGVPIGAKIRFPEDAQGVGYILADGSTYDPVEYPDLYTALGSATLPNCAADPCIAAGWKTYIKAFHEPNVATDFKRLKVTVTNIPNTQNSYASYDPANYTLKFWISEGPQGPRGPQGVQGPQGEQGVRGPEGPRGLQGIKGDQGERGPQGAQGQMGLTGAQGPRGEQGPQGIQGPIGQTGPRGLKGDKGTEGEQGPTGEQGPAGPASIGCAFGRFKITPEGMLVMEYYGDSGTDTLTIDDNGCLIIGIE